jgi:hypothetical protein
MMRPNAVLDNCPKCREQIDSKALRALFRLACQTCGECDALESGMDIMACDGLQDCVRVLLDDGDMGVIK